MRQTVCWFLLLFLISKPLAAEDDLVVKAATKEIVLTGYTRSETTVTVSSEVSGKVLRVNYDVGDVTGSKAFFEIDPTFINLEIESTVQSIENVRVSQAKNRSRRDYLEKEYIRLENLFKRNSTAESKRDTAAEDLSQARIESQSLSVEMAILKAKLKELRERKRRHSIVVPAGWIVIKKMVEAGEIIVPGTPLAKVADYGTLVVPLSVSSRELNAIQDLPPTFAITVEGRSSKAALNWINPEFDEKTRKLSIELVLRDYSGPRRGGLLCRLPLHIESDGLLIPKRAVTSRFENPRVKLKKNGQFVQIIILGETQEAFIVGQNSVLTPGVRLATNSETNSP